MNSDDFEKKKEGIIKEKKEKLFIVVKNALARDFHIPPEKITPEARFREDLNFDSVDTVQANIVLEEVFNIDISDEDIDKISTVDDLVCYLYLRLKKERS